MNYRSVASLNKDILVWLDQLPSDIDLVVGIPRSGLLVASLISLHRNIPLTDVQGLIQGKLIQSGARYKKTNIKDFLSEPRKVLVVDDSVWSGSQMRKTKKELEQAELIHEIIFGAVYVDVGKEGIVSYFQRILASPRIFEWNYLHHGSMGSFCIDIDGVLCRDPLEKENDDGKNYEDFILNVPMRIVPKGNIGWLVTCRLEKYRSLTEQWLLKNNIKYENLIMWNLPDMESRQKSGEHGKYKAEIYIKTGASLFIESSIRQAKEIATLSGKNVICFETGEMISPTEVNRKYRKALKYINLAVSDPQQMVSIIKNRILLKK